MFGTYVYVSKYLSVIVMVDWYRARGELGSNRRMILRITGDAICGRRPEVVRFVQASLTTTANSDLPGSSYNPK